MVEGATTIGPGCCSVPPPFHTLLVSRHDLGSRSHLHLKAVISKVPPRVSVGARFDSTVKCHVESRQEFRYVERSPTRGSWYPSRSNPKPIVTRCHQHPLRCSEHTSDKPLNGRQHTSGRPAIFTPRSRTPHARVAPHTSYLAFLLHCPLPYALCHPEAFHRFRRRVDPVLEEALSVRDSATHRALIHRTHRSAETANLLEKGAYNLNLGRPLCKAGFGHVIRRDP